MSVALSFHRTFALSRPAVSKVVLLALKSGVVSREELAKTDLGTIYQEAMPRYAYRAGLLDKKYSLTLFGRYVAKFDPYLNRQSTQWLMHYYLSAPHGPTAFWHELVYRFFRPGNTFTDEALVEELTAFATQQLSKIPAPRTIRSTATIFVGTYLKSDGLGRLGLLQATEAGYRVAWADPPPLWAFAYALAEYWQAYYDGQLTASLDDFVHGAFGSIFMVSEQSMTELLLELKREGMVDVFRTARPYQIVLLQPDPEEALRRLYGAGEEEGDCSDPAQR